MTNAPLCALAHRMNALLAGVFELMALLAAILAFLSSCDIIMRIKVLFRLQRYELSMKNGHGRCFLVIFTYLII